MNQKRSTRPVIVRRAVSASGTLVHHARTLVFVPLLATIIVGGTYWGWQVVRQSGAERSEYRIDPSDIEISPEPKWIRGQNLLSEIIRNASLDQRMSILDDRVTERIGLAFAGHPWVERVVGVEKYHPARIKVSLVYREPVAVVAGKGHEFPIDRNGISLPVQDFAPSELIRFAKIRGVPVQHRVKNGEPWGDSRVYGAAKIADAFGAGWRDFDLVAIEPSSQPIRDHRDVYTYELVTRNGVRIPWGPQYLEPHPREPTAHDKTERLRAYVDQFGTLDGASLKSVEENETTQTATRTDAEYRER